MKWLSPSANFSLLVDIRHRDLLELPANRAVESHPLDRFEKALGLLQLPDLLQMQLRWCCNPVSLTHNLFDVAE
jgi:hypothetical protein